MDGFYSLDELPPGSYTLTVAEPAARAVGARPPKPRPLELSPEGNVLDGEDLILEVAAELTPPAGEE